MPNVKGGGVRIVPSSSIDVLRQEAASLAAQKAKRLTALTSVIGAAVARAEARSAPDLPERLAMTMPVVITLKPNSSSLRGLMPADPLERGALNAFMKDELPLHLAMNRDSVTETLKAALENDGLKIHSLSFHQARRGPLQLHVQRVSPSVAEAFAEEAARLTTDTLARVIARLPRPVTVTELALGPDDTVVYGLMRLANDQGWSKEYKFERDVGLSQDEVSALANDKPIMTEAVPADLTAKLLRYALNRPLHDDWRGYLPVTREQLSAMKDAYAVAHDVATAHEAARAKRYPTPPVFAQPLAGLTQVDRDDAVSAIVAHVRSELRTDGEFLSLVGVSRAQMLRMIDGSLEVSPVPVTELVTTLLSVRRIDEESTWWQHTDVDVPRMLELRERIAAAKEAPEPPTSDATFDLRASALLDTVAPRHRAVLAECLTAVSSNKLCSDAQAFHAVFKVPREEFQAMLAGATLSSPLSARQLTEAVLGFVADSNSAYFGALLSYSRDAVRAALHDLR